jgi:hypothetical protein
MERATAIKKLGKILGKHFGYRVDPKAPDQDEREEARARLREETPKREALKKALEDRKTEILNADAEYQRLRAEYIEAGKICAKLSSATYHYRITVGTSGDMFFSVKAQGDSWEEVISKLTEKATAA